MYILVVVIIILICILLGLVVLIQNPKGGGLSAAFGGVGNQILGAKRSTDFVEKATWYLASALLVICLLSAAVIDRPDAVVEQDTATMIQGNANTYNGGAVAPQPPAQPQPGGTQPAGGGQPTN